MCWKHGFIRLGATAGRGFMRLAAFLLLSAFIGLHPANAAEPPTLVVPRCDIVLQIAAPAIQIEDASGGWELAEMGGDGAVVTAQLSPAMAEDGTADAGRRRLYAVIPAAKEGDGPRRFRLRPSERKTDAATAWKITSVDEKSIRIDEGRRPVFVYNHGEITCPHVPESDSRRSRACYVHPVWGIDGERLTDDFPSDHYHHHGIFWTWPHVEIDGRQYDLWMGSNIRQKLVRWIHRSSGPVAAELAVENGWFADGNNVMIERVWIRAFRASDDARAIDFEFAFTPISRPITLRGAEKKSYGGLTMRFAVRSKEDATITVPEERTREDMSNTRLPWADMSYPFAGGSSLSGAAMFVDPGHPDYPPTWLTRHYGPLCIGWPGVEGKTFPPGETIRLNYRVWIHKNALDNRQLQRAYRSYADAMKVRWE